MINSILLAIGILLPIVNPISAGFFFNKLTKSKSFNKFKIVNLSIFTYLFTLLAFVLAGSYLLGFFGITIHAFRIAGGIYLAKIAFEMLNPDLRNESLNLSKIEEIAVIPLAIPLLAGPGAMTAALVMSDLYGLIPSIIAILFVGILAWCIFYWSDVILNKIGKMGTMIVERILGLLVLVIAIQMILNGIYDFVLLF